MLRKGLTSELFFLAFLVPETGYTLAQRLQGTKKTPNTSKTTLALKKLEKDGYLRREEDGKYHHVPEKLVRELIDYLKNEQETILDEKEKRILRNLVSENYFFIFAAHDVIHKMIDRPKGIHDLDTLKTISDKIGFISALILESKKKRGDSNKPIINQSFEKNQEDLAKFVVETNKMMEAKIKGKKSVRNKKMKSVNILNNVMKSMLMIGILFHKVPDTTIEKFACLWAQYDGFRFGTNIRDVNPIGLLNSYS